MKNNKIKNKPGFTLVEIITVLFIVSIGMVGVLSLIIQNIQGHNLNKNSLAAYQLAQEGIELIRKVRDTNWNNSVVYNTALAPGLYYMDYLDDTPNSLATDTQGDLYKSDTDFYAHASSANLTSFRRIIEIVSTSTQAMTIHSRVSWIERGQSYSYNLEATLYDWK
jgi:prepilin-type N-terminal cleavage/methylation domain-containing protein